jgi:DNA repair protein RadC
VAPSAKARASDDQAILADVLRSVSPSAAEALAFDLIHRFGSLGSVLSARPAAIARTVPDPRIPALLKSIARATRHAATAKLRKAQCFASLDVVVSFLQASIAYSRRELVLAFHLNGSGHLISEEVVALGSILEAPIYPREIVRRALDLGTASIILAHNHPSGDASPSAADIQATKEIAAATRIFGIDLFDHVIVAGSEWTSLRAEGLI